MKKYLALLTVSSFLMISGVAFGQNNNKEIILEEANGVKTLTITTTVKGEKTTKTFTGKEAEAQIKQMESQGNGIERSEFVADDGRLLVKITPKKATTSTK